ncbi:MAG: hypothetical protein D4R64_10995 [Porphyromonadaceae bacterium]|nr:MAG: hypothetical protein D4R64_10995 [Porphyromonadaceae bacterium]
MNLPRNTIERFLKRFEKIKRGATHPQADRSEYIAYFTFSLVRIIHSAAHQIRAMARHLQINSIIQAEISMLAMTFQIGIRSGCSTVQLLCMLFV